MAEEKKEYLTKKKYDELVEELKYLKNTRRKEVAEALDYARGLGDLSENAEYHEARSEQADVEERIAKVDRILKNATVVEDRHGEYAMIGSTITVKKVSDGTERTFMIVGSAESDMAAGKISNQSPLGAAVLGKKKGDHFSFQAPSGKVEYTVLDIK
jgi:transcription elongation factor GreA